MGKRIRTLEKKSKERSEWESERGKNRWRRLKDNQRA